MPKPTPKPGGRKIRSMSTLSSGCLKKRSQIVSLLRAAGRMDVNLVIDVGWAGNIVGDLADGIFFVLTI
jgi:hypothetical protein